MNKNQERNYRYIADPSNKVLRVWDKGVPFEAGVFTQAQKCLQLPCVNAVCLMPDAHIGKGSTVGSVIITHDAVIPAATGADLNCGMRAAKTNLCLNDFKEKRQELFHAISRKIPHGRTDDGGEGDRGRWHDIPADAYAEWHLNSAPSMSSMYEDLVRKFPGIDRGNKTNVEHLGTLGTGNHFIELSADENEKVWILIHSGSRGMGARIGNFFTRLAKELCDRWCIQLPDPDLAFLPRGSEEFNGFMQAVSLCNKFAFASRKIMLNRVVEAINETLHGEFIPPSCAIVETFDCHHNFISEENFHGKNLFVTRKGAVRARIGDRIIIPGSMGARSFICDGLGNTDSFHSCSHGAGRKMSRTEALRTISVDDHIAATLGVACLKDESVVDESPAAYKDIDAVINAENDLVHPTHILKQFVCIKGAEKGDNKRRKKNKQVDCQ